MRAATQIVVLAVALGLLAGPAGAAPSDSGRLTGRLPDNSPVVSIDQPRGTVLDALSTIAKQTGWSLVVVAPESATARPLTLQVSRRQAGEVLDMVLEAGSLRAAFADGVLRVRSDTSVTSGDSWRERRRERRGRHGSERVVFGRSLDIGANETVDKAVAIGGSVRIAGHVRRDAVAIGGSVTLLPGAYVEGDAVAIGGAVSVPEDARLEGDNVSLGGAIPTTVGSMTRWVVAGPHMFSRFSFGARLMRAVLLLVIAVLIAAAFPGALTRVETYLVHRPGLSALGGVVILLGFVPLCVLLAVSIIGIPLIPVAMMLLIAVLLFGFAVSAAWLGGRMRATQEHRTPVKSVAWGGAILAVVGLVPWLGATLLILVASVSAGATLLSRFGRTPAAAV